MEHRQSVHTVVSVEVQDLLRAVTAPRDKRTPQQVSKLLAWISALPTFGKVNQAGLHGLLHHLFSQEVHAGHILYRAGDSADWYYLIVEGTITLTDVKDVDEGHDPEVAVLGPGACFGEEEILSRSKRAFTATAGSTVTLLKLPMLEYKKVLEDEHMGVFETKITFLSSLSPLKPLKPDTVRKLAPYFTSVTFCKGDVVVRQGEKADAMYAIRSGTACVLVDPHYKEGMPGLGELDPKKTVNVVTLDAGAIIGDVTVMAKVRCRTASVVVQSNEVVCYKIRRGTFLRRLPTDQLEILRRLAAEKLRLMDQKINSRPRHKDQNQILQGHNLRQLMFDQNAASTETHPEEYQQLLHVLRRYKRSATPMAVPKGAPETFAKHHHSPHAISHAGGAPPGSSSLAGALKSVVAAANGPTANLVPEIRDNPPAVATAGPHRDWRFLPDRNPALADGGAAFKQAILRIMPEDPPASFHGLATCRGTQWRPLSPRRAFRASLNMDASEPSNQPEGTVPHPINYSSRPFIASVTLKTLVQQSQPDDELDFAVPMSTCPVGPSSPVRPCAEQATRSHASRPGSASISAPWTSNSLWRTSTALGSPKRAHSPMHSRHYALNFHTDPEGWAALSSTPTSPASSGPSTPKHRSCATQDTAGSEDPLDAVSRPLLDTKPGLNKLHRGAAHFRPTVPKAML